MNSIKRLLIMIISFVALACALSVGAAAEGDEYVKLEKVVQVNEKQLICFFSEPIAFNLKGESTGPYMAIRIVDNMDNLIYFPDELGNMKYFQFEMVPTFLDEEHDKLLLTLVGDQANTGAKTVTQIMNFEGGLSSLKGNNVRLCIEETPFAHLPANAPTTDGNVCNITSLDGERYLYPTKPTGRDAVYMEIGVDLNYKFDATQTEPVKNYNKINGNVLFYNEDLIEAPIEEIPPVEEKVTVEPYIILGAAVVVGIVCLLVIIKPKKKGGKA